MRPLPPWSALQVKHLAALRAVADGGSFRAGARALGYSQSAISQQIAALEAIVGERLLTRPTSRAQRVTPTAAGEVLLAESEAIVGRLRAAERRLRAIRGGRAGSVRVGLPPGVASFFLAEALDAFGEVAPSIGVDVVDALADDDLFRLLDAGDVELAFVVLPAEPGPYRVQPVFGDELLLVVPDDSALADRRPLALADLDGLPLLGLRRCRATDALLVRLAAQGVRPDLVFRSDDAATLLGLLGRRGEAALLPALSIPDGERLTVRTFATHPYRRFGIAWHEARPPVGASRAFAEVCRALLAGDRRLAPRLPGEPAELRVSLQHAR